MFRADVRYLLPVQYDVNNQPTGKRLVGDGDLTTNKNKNGQFYPSGLKVQAMEGGTGNVTPQIAGFSLFVVYRNPSEPLRKIVVYENPKNEHGSPGQVYVQPNLATPTTQTFAGIFKSTTDTAALFTLAGATNQKNTHDRIRFQGNPAPPQLSWPTMATTLQGRTDRFGPSLGKRHLQRELVDDSRCLYEFRTVHRFWRNAGDDVRPPAIQRSVRLSGIVIRGLEYGSGGCR
jgi:hypothetical protein